MFGYLLQVRDFQRERDCIEHYKNESYFKFISGFVYEILIQTRDVAIKIVYFHVAPSMTATNFQELRAPIQDNGKYFAGVRVW